MLARIDTEKRLSEAANRASKSKIKKILNSQSFKTISGIAIGAFAIAAGNYMHDVVYGINGKKLIGERKISKDAFNIGKEAILKGKYKIIPFLKYFKTSN